MGNGSSDTSQISARDALIRAALHLFVSQGYHTTTTTQITQSAGVAKGTLYFHFKSKKDLALEMFRMYAGEAASGIAERLTSAESTAERIHMLIAHIFEWCEQHPEEASYLFLLRHDEAFGKAPVIMDRVHPGQLVNDVILQGQMAGDIDDGELPALQAVWGIPYAFIRDRLEGWTQRDLRENVHGAALMCCRALGVDGEPYRAAGMSESGQRETGEKEVVDREEELPHLQTIPTTTDG